MYAVVFTGGKQYRVTEGQTIKVESLSVEPGQAVTFDQVLMIGGDEVKIGTPYLKQAHVDGEVVSNGRHKKIKIIKFQRRKHHMKRMGHRQNYTEVKINTIKA